MRQANDGASAGGLAGATPAQGVAGQVQITIDEVVAIARKHLPGAEDDVTAATRPFRQLVLDPAAFGEVPVARALGVQHQAAHEVFVETVRGVSADLREFAARLLASAQAHQASDDAAHAALISFADGYQGHVSKADRSFERARVQQGDKLEVPSETPEHGVTPDGPEVPATPPPVDSPAPASGTGFEG